jgi:hypothetical protein
MTLVPKKVSPFFLNMTGAYDTGTHKDWITDTICIGNGNSSYESFDVVVNADYPTNRFKHGGCGRREEKLDSHCCTLYLVGLYDDDSEPLDFHLNYVMPRLRAKYTANPRCRFLFHCYAGKSRSVVIALAFLVEVLNMTLENAFALVKEKRPIIEPRPFFMEILRRRYSPRDLNPEDDIRSS